MDERVDPIMSVIVYSGRRFTRLPDSCQSFIVVILKSGPFEFVSLHPGIWVIFIIRPSERSIEVIAALDPGIVLMLNVRDLAALVVLVGRTIAAWIDYDPEPIHARPAFVVIVSGWVLLGIRVTRSRWRRVTGQ